MNVFEFVKIDVFRPLVQTFIMEVVGIPLIIEQVLFLKSKIVCQNNDMNLKVVDAVEHWHFNSPLIED